VSRSASIKQWGGGRHLEDIVVAGLAALEGDIKEVAQLVLQLLPWLEQQAAVVAESGPVQVVPQAFAGAAIQCGHLHRAGRPSGGAPYRAAEIALFKGGLALLREAQRRSGK